MSRPRDPWWLAPVDRLYGFALHLYPRRFREAWGASMRQALRDRCRELAHTQRHPLPWVCVDLLPDLAASAGREQWTAFEEEATMKRMSLLTMLLLGSLSLLWWSKTYNVGSDLLFSATKWVQNREQRALESAYAEYRLDLIRTALASDRTDERALAYSFARLQGWSVDADVLPQELQTQLDAIVADVSNTHLGRYLAAASCRSPSALAHLQAAESDNGAVWAMTATCRQQAHDNQGARAALVRMAQSKTYDSRSGALLVALTDVLSRKPLPPALERELSPQGTQFLNTALWVAHDREHDGLHSLCWSMQQGTADAALQVECRAAYAVLAASADSEWIRRIGRRRIAGADGQAITAEAEPFYQRLNARVDAWRRMPAEQRATLAGSGVDERALLARAANAMQPL
ncbi:hypothetical protein [Lysobacter sp. CFH 32150]|uniref:hypothetical protein n=1 Tax=Lysobacter sp. CFH 32150 TaxID=2927128 RepID=UPI001FA6CAE1|nr:hypothetical protein [Lysobacter sp. CFH 32150]MCI4568088.1 hypothetical protein [Lysobacter sp. CFH 32150]